MELSKEQAKEQLQKVEKERNELLEIINKPEPKAPSTMDTITSYEAACEDQGMEPLTIEQFNFLPERQRKSAFAGHKLDTVAFSLRGKTDADFDNTNQKKWGPIFTKTPSGFVFSFSHYDLWLANTNVGARLCVYTQHESDFFGTQFAAEWNDFHSK